MRPLRPVLVVSGFLAGVLAISTPATAQIHRVQNFTTNLPSGSNATTGNRFFTSTQFAGASNSFTAANNVGHFRDGRLIYPDVSLTYNWNDTVPSDFSPGADAFRLNPDRGDTATAFPGEASGGARLSDVFSGTGNLSYLLDGENNSPFSVELYYSADRSRRLVTDSRFNDTVDLLILERGANSSIGVRAILADATPTNPNDNTRTDTVVVDFTPPSGTQGLTGYQLNSLEIDNDQNVAGVGLDVSEFRVGGNRIAIGTSIIGFEFLVDSSFTANGPDLLGFVASAAPVPEPATVGLAAAAGLLAAGARRRLRRR